MSAQLYSSPPTNTGATDTNVTTDTGASTNTAIVTTAIEMYPDTNMPRYEPSRTHSNIQTIWDEWYGIGYFRSVLNEFGGIDGLEKKFGTRWRIHWKESTRKYFSRLKLIVVYIQGIMQIKNDSLNERY